MVSKDNLDKRICDCEGSQNSQTYREFIRQSEKEFDFVEVPIDKLSDTALHEYMELLDYLWDK